MSRRFRAFVWWLIAVAIPVQGMAAIVMPLCAPSPFVMVTEAASDHVNGPMAHDHPMAPVVVGMVHMDHAQAPAYAPEHPSEHAPDHVHAMAAHGGGHSTPPDTDHAGHSGHGMLKCCSAGCSMAACFDSSPAEPARAPSIAPAQPGVSAYTGVILDGLDRPPRHHLA